MKDTDIKQEIIELCNSMITFWGGLQREVEKIPCQNQADIVLKWKSYFPEHNDIIQKLIYVKMHIDNLQRELIEHGESRYEE